MLLLQVVGTMGGGKVGTHFIKRLQQGWDVKTLLYYGAPDTARAPRDSNSTYMWTRSRALNSACSLLLSQIKGMPALADITHGPRQRLHARDRQSHLTDDVHFPFLQHADVQQKKQLDDLGAKFVQDFDSFLSQCDVVSTPHVPSAFGSVARYCSRPIYLTAAAEAAHQADLSTLAHVGDCPLLCTAQVAINMPLKCNTRNLFNSATLNKMKKGAVLVRDFGSTPAHASHFRSSQ